MKDAVIVGLSTAKGEKIKSGKYRFHPLRKWSYDKGAKDSKGNTQSLVISRYCCHTIYVPAHNLSIIILISKCCKMQKGKKKLCVPMFALRLPHYITPKPKKQTPATAAPFTVPS